MSKIINARITVLEYAIWAVASINKCIDKLQDTATAALNTRLDKLAQGRRDAADAVRIEPHLKFYQTHDQLAELRAEFIEASQRLLDKAKQHISSEAVTAAEAKADALNNEAAELLARKK